MDWTLEERFARWRRHARAGGVIILIAALAFILGRCSA